MINLNTVLNTIIHGDSKDVLKEFPSDCIDVILTSPPYDDLRDYNGQIVWNFEIFKEIADQLYRVTKPGGVLVWVVGDKTENGRKTLTSYKQALYFDSIGFNMYDVIIYEKTGSGPPHPNRYFNSFEYMFVLSKGKPKTVNILHDKPNKWAGYDTYGEVTRREKNGTLTNKGKKTIAEMGVRTNIWKYANGKGFSTKDSIAYKHPAIFPEKLVEDHLLSWSVENDIVLDPFAGSGTTGKIARQLNRNYILIEAVDEYCELANERLNGASNDANDNIVN